MSNTQGYVNALRLARAIKLDEWYLQNVFYRESDTLADYSRVCKDCWQFPNRCDHFGVRVMHIRISDVTAEQAGA